MPNSHASWHAIWNPGKSVKHREKALVIASDPGTLDEEPEYEGPEYEGPPFVDITGTEKSDRIEVLDAIAWIDGMGGNDVITISSGRVNGGAGNDTLSSTGPRLGGESVVLYGDDGNDILRIDGILGRWSYTYLDGGAGNDALYGGRASDHFFTQLSGGAGNDLLVGTIADEIISGTNFFYPGPGNDRIVLGEHAYNYIDFGPYLSRQDEVIGNGAWDELRFNGTAGDERLVISGHWIVNGIQYAISGIEVLIYDGWGGNDYVDASAAEGLQYVVLSADYGTDVLIGSATAENRFQLWDANPGDVVVGGAGVDVLKVGDEVFTMDQLAEFASLPGGGMSISGAQVSSIEYVEVYLPQREPFEAYALDTLAGTGVSTVVFHGGYGSKDVVIDFSRSTEVNIWWIPWWHFSLDLTGSQLGDVVLNGGSPMRVNGGPGDDWIDLNYEFNPNSPSADTVVMEPGGGNDFVLRFMVEPLSEYDMRDLLDVSAFGIATFADIMALGETVVDEDGSLNARFTFEDGTSVTFYATDLSWFTAANFIFAGSEGAGAELPFDDLAGFIPHSIGPGDQTMLLLPSEAIA